MSLYYPMMLKIKGKSCRVIGGGRVAERKVMTLLEYGAVITVISPKITEGLHKLVDEKKIVYLERNYKTGDLSGSYLAYALTDNVIVNSQCKKEAEESNVFINVADSEELSDFILPASINRGSLTISVSTEGKSPMLSRKIRHELEEQYGEEYEEILDTLGEIRIRALKEIVSIKDRRELFHQLVYEIDFFYPIEDVKKKMWETYQEFIRY